MFGTYRLILACLVALSHFGLIVSGFNPGQWAVVSFYVLSGFLMENQFHKLSPAGEYRFFYLDRLLRVFPLFITVLVLTALLTRPSFPTFAVNSLLLPLNYHDFIHVPILVGPTWSLACEVHFYLLVPILACAPTLVIRCIASCSMILFIVSPFLPYSTYWAYIWLPGILFAFLSGMLLHRKDVRFLAGIWILFAILLLAFGWTKFGHLKLPTGIHINVCVGYLIALPVVYWLSSKSPKVRLDQQLGLLSFPLFLIHDPVKQFIERYSAHPSLFVLLGSSLVCAFLLVLLIEKPFDKIRYRVRKRMS